MRGAELDLVQPCGLIIPDKIVGLESASLGMDSKGRHGEAGDRDGSRPAPALGWLQGPAGTEIPLTPRWWLAAESGCPSAT